MPRLRRDQLAALLTLQGERVMADYPHTVTVLDRMLAAGIARHNAETHLRYGRVHVDGHPVTQPNTPVTRQQSVVLRRPPAPEVELPEVDL